MKKDKEAFLQVLEDHKKIIFKVSHSYCQDHEDRKDLVQDIIVQLWKSFPKYDAQYKITTWIYRIALNVAISFYRKERYRKNQIVSWEDSVLLIAQDDGHHHREDLAFLQHFINQLDTLNRALMILYLDDHSYEEIAAILDISASNVGTKINRIKQKLKNQFKTLENQNHGNR